MSIILLLSLLSLAFGRVEIVDAEFPHVEDEYIITYYTNTTHDIATQHWALMESLGVALKSKYSAGSHTGFAAKITDKKVLAALQEDPLVEFIQVNGYAYALQTCSASQPEAPWGTARTSHLGDLSRGLTLRYAHSSSGGNGVSVFIIDTGILTSHEDFGGRTSTGISFNGANRDGNGHGTHCAGTVAGKVNGIAKAATVVPVKVLGDGGSGTWDQVMDGVDWVTNNGVVGRAVASMSLGGTGQNPGLTASINALVAKGIPCVVAAGNSNDDACDYTPAGIPSVISVGATALGGAWPNQNDARSSFSNYGTCVHIFAPGTNIPSAWIPGNDDYNTISGTSMACPHVAGQVAVLLSENNYNLTPAAIKKMLQDRSQKDFILNVGTGSPNFLLYNGCQT